MTRSLLRKYLFLMFAVLESLRVAKSFPLGACTILLGSAKAWTFEPVITRWLGDPVASAVRLNAGTQSNDNKNVDTTLTVNVSSKPSALGCILLSASPYIP